MQTQYTLASASECSEKQHQYKIEILVPEEMKAQQAQNRVTDLLYAAVQKGDRAEFHRLWQKHMVPLARKKEAADTKASSEMTPTASPR